MNPFDQMATVLTAHTTPTWAPQSLPSAGLSRTERMRRLLKAAKRPVTPEEIAWDMAEHFPNFGVNLVWLLLKHDLGKGRVLLDGGRYSYNHAFDDAEQIAVREAVKLLKSHGFKVAAPTKEI